MLIAERICSPTTQELRPLHSSIHEVVALARAARVFHFDIPSCQCPRVFCSAY